MICKKCGREINRYQGIERHNAVCDKLPLPDVLKAEYDAGKGVKALAQHYGVSFAALRNHLDAAGAAQRSMSEQHMLKKGGSICRRCGILLSDEMARPSRCGLCCVCVAADERPNYKWCVTGRASLMETT
jgi:predicted Zn-ribbon and HTH transcriptional regulator